MSGSSSGLLRLDRVSLTYPQAVTPTLTDVSVSARPGRVTGLIGANGSGKSTVLRIAAGHLTPSAGTVEAPPSIGYLPQQPGTDEHPQTIADAVERAVAPIRAIEEHIESLAHSMAAHPDDGDLAEAWDRCLTEAERRGLWSLDARISTVLNGLGVGALARDRPLTEISGGQRRRLDLALVLLEHPHALVLDEPTNHLDDAASDFLIAELTDWPGPVLVASHDRWFLDAAASALVDMDPGLDPHGHDGGLRGTAYTGNYTDYLKQREQLRLAWQRRFADQEEQRRRWAAEAQLEADAVFHNTTAKSEARITQKFYSDRAATTLTRRSRNARRRLEEIERTTIQPPPDPVRLGPVQDRPDGPAPARRGVALELKDVVVEQRVGPVSLTLEHGEHLLLTGPNGSGKSTVLQTVAGALAPSTGSMRLDPGLRIGVLTQELAPAVSPPDGEHQSPGQRRRVELMRLLADPPDLLLLDEPTNHLALGLVEDLERALEQWSGTVILCTHDRWVRRRWTGSRLDLGRDLG